MAGAEPTTFHGLRILARSRGQRIRGIRHRHHRIKRAIGDHIYDLKLIATQESRNSTAQWRRGEVIGALALQARQILIGNWLHLDGLMARMKDGGRYKVLEFSLIRDGARSTMALTRLPPQTCRRG